MSATRIAPWAYTLTAWATLALVGCGPSPVKVTGNLTKKGQPIAFHDQVQVTLTFAPQEGERKSGYLAKIVDGKSYEVDVLPGPYKTAISIYDHTKKQAIPASKKFGASVVEIRGAQTLDLDLDP